MAATSLQISLNGTWNDLTPYVLNQSITCRLNTLDWILIDPPLLVFSSGGGPLFGQAWNSTAVLGLPISLSAPGWTGTLTTTVTSDPVDLINGHQYVTCTATNTSTGTSTTAPFNLSDAPVAVTTYLELESGTGHILLEDASGALLLESGGSYGYRSLRVTNQLNLDATILTTGSCTVNQAGLWPGMTFTLTSSNQGISAVTYTVTLVTVTFPTNQQPEYLIEFGGTPPTLSSWAHAQ